MREREEKISEALEQIMPEQFEKSSVETALSCEKNSREMAAGFLKALREAAEPVMRGGKEECDGVHYLLFSCLHSSMFLRKYLIRIDLMGEGFYGDLPMATAYWNAGDIYRFFEQDIEQIRQKMVQKVPRIRAYEVDEMRYAYAPYYHRMAKGFIREMLEGILESGADEGKESVEKEEEKGEEQEYVKVLFGEYMGEADLLFTMGREKTYEIFQNLCG